MIKTITKSAILIICLFWVVNGCKVDDKSDKKVDVSLLRFEKYFYEIQPDFIFDSIPKLKTEYKPFFLNTDDEFWRNILIDSLQRRLYESVKDTFTDLTEEVKHLKELFDNYRNTFDTCLQKVYVYTYVSGLDYDFPIIFSDSLLFISLDVYLGEDHPAYAFQPRYLARQRNRRNIPIDAAEAVADYLLRDAHSASEALISHLVKEGIKLYIMRLLLPFEREYNLLKYTKEQYKFCLENEKNIWLYFINNRLLFDSNIMTKKRFVDPAPFTRLGTDFDQKVPGRIGRWVGYQIVNSYMKKNSKATPLDLINNTNYLLIFNQSGYKP